MTPDAKPQLAAPTGSDFSSGLRVLIDVHEALLGRNPYCYCEIAYTRQTGWMAWLCSKPQADDPNRQVLGVGQGQSANEAAFRCVDSYCNGGPPPNAEVSDQRGAGSLH